ncbi:MAG: FAD-dependent thymidylate synthase [Prevotella sp.]
MKIIEPNVELWLEKGCTHEQHIARCARVCYGHEGEGKDPKRLVQSLIKRGHVSMLRHASRYFLYTAKDGCVYDADGMRKIAWNTVCEYEHETEYEPDYYILSTNEQEYRFSKHYLYNAEEYNGRELTLDELLDYCRKDSYFFDAVRFSFYVTTQRSTSVELNRKSPNSIAESSTRRISNKNGIVICKPHWFNDEHNLPVTSKPIYPEQESVLGWNDAERHYVNLLNMGLKPEDARTALPYDAATKVVYTYSVSEWRDIIGLRYYGYTGEPQPNAKIIAGMIRDQINEFAKDNGIEKQI